MEHPETPHKKKITSNLLVKKKNIIKPDGIAELKINISEKKA